MKYIQLQKGMRAFVDDTDYDWLTQFRWFAQKGYSTWYAVTKILGKPVQMHRVILNIQDPILYGDHKDHNGLNNQRHNLRTATRSQNMANRTNDYNALSKHLGVVWQESHKKWRGRIQKNGKQIHLGYFPSEELAALAYNKAAFELHGEFANLNVIDPTANILSAAD